MKTILDAMCYEIEKNQSEEYNYPSCRDSIINKYASMIENKKKINVTIVGKEDDDHFTYVEYDGLYWEFYTDGYDGQKSKDVIDFLKFLGFEVFVVNKNKGSKKVILQNSEYVGFI